MLAGLYSDADRHDAIGEQSGDDPGGVTAGADEPLGDVAAPRLLHADHTEALRIPGRREAGITATVAQGPGQP